MVPVHSAYDVISHTHSKGAVNATVCRRSGVNLRVGPICVRLHVWVIGCHQRALASRPALVKVRCWWKESVAQTAASSTQPPTRRRALGTLGSVPFRRCIKALWGEWSSSAIDGVGVGGCAEPISPCADKGSHFPDWSCGDQDNENRPERNWTTKIVGISRTNPFL